MSSTSIGKTYTRLNVAESAPRRWSRWRSLFRAMQVSSQRLFSFGALLSGKASQAIIASPGAADHREDLRLQKFIGMPSRLAVFGEGSGGESFVNRHEKLAHPDYPYWREPLFVAASCRIFGRIGELPGLGVIGLEFMKP